MLKFEKNGKRILEVTDDGDVHVLDEELEIQMKEKKKEEDQEDKDE